MGVAGRATPLVSASGGAGPDAVAGRCPLRLGSAAVAALAGSHRYRARSPDRTRHPVIPRVLPPVHSPLTASILGSGWRSLFTREASALDSARQLLLQNTGARDALLTDSGTSALALALRLAVGARRDCPRVVLPAWGCYDLATAADTADVEVVLYDLDPRTLGPDWDSLNRALSAGAAAVVVVHAYGLLVDLSEIARRAAGSGTFIIEDAAQAVGA